MNLRDLKKYALIGLLTRIDSEKKRLSIIEEPTERKRDELDIKNMVQQYNELLTEMQNEEREKRT